MNRFTTAGGAIDVHQHLWPAPLIEALRARRRPPRLAGWTLELAGEPDFEVDSCHHDPLARARANAEEGIGRALISLSSPLGIELLPAAEADELLCAWREGALALIRAGVFGAWAAASVRAPDPLALERDLQAGFAGLQLPACALLDAADFERAAPLLSALERSGRPLFIHPGPARAARGQPPWWAPVVEYVAQMHAAWFAWRAHGASRYPRLRVLFAILAGLAPLHDERLAARAGPARDASHTAEAGEERAALAWPGGAAGAGAQGAIDPRLFAIDQRLFVETSSYGVRAIDAAIRVLGVDQLVCGSDRPYGRLAPPALGAAAEHAMRRANPLRLLGAADPRSARRPRASPNPAPRPYASQNSCPNPTPQEVDRGHAQDRTRQPRPDAA
jgi:hypothetical protein